MPSIVGIVMGLKQEMGHRPPRTAHPRRSESRRNDRKIELEYTTIFKVALGHNIAKKKT